MMAEPQIKFDDGAAYETMMGIWSRLAGEDFLGWLALPKGLRCVDVGCGNGAFTELLVERCAPREVQGIDPSEGQLAFARKRHSVNIATFSKATRWRCRSRTTVRLATMALVIFFVPDPAKGVAEMKRVVRSGGTVAAYAWDMLRRRFSLRTGALRNAGARSDFSDAAQSRTRRASKPLRVVVGKVRGLGPPSKRARSPCSARFADFEEFWGSSIDRRRASVRSVSGHAAWPMSTLLKDARFAPSCRRISDWAASPTARAPMPSRGRVRK